jgi:sec-independent protein translocase protein TatB
MIFGINGWELILLGLLAVFILGPERLPGYAAKLAQGVRKLRVMAEGAKGQLKDQLGPDYEDIDWRQYDPRQYDPRRIVREALLEPLEDAAAPLRGTGSGAGTAGAVGAGAMGAGAAGAAAGAISGRDDAWTGDAGSDVEDERPTPYDPDAT